MKLAVLLAGSALFCLPARAADPPAKFGHRKYPVAAETGLAEAGRYRESGRVVLLQRPAADAFRALVEAAAKDGVSVVPVSGHRTLAYQKGLFDRGTAKHGSARAAAKWVAPPGYSEHHTGWALDLADADAPETDVDPSFERTRAFAWLSAHAARFGFELSFPKDNPGGVSYEPWHWRFVGTPESRGLFHGEQRP